VYGETLHAPAYMVRGGVTYRIITDQLGSPRLVVDVATGVVAQRMDYDEFGNVISDTSPGFQPFGFAGGLYDRDTGLVRFGARDYDAAAGRWTAPDPGGFRGGPNRYSYADNDPINLIDPLGYQSEASQSTLWGLNEAREFALDVELEGRAGAHAREAVRTFWSSPELRNYNGSFLSERAGVFGTNAVNGTVNGRLQVDLARACPRVAPPAPRVPLGPPAPLPPSATVRALGILEKGLLVLDIALTAKELMDDLEAGQPSWATPGMGYIMQTSDWKKLTGR